MSNTVEQAGRLPALRETLISVAPMMERTDRHCRYFMRLLSPNVRLYTEMVNANAILKGDPQRHLSFDASEHPVALQLGGNEPVLLAAAAKIAEDYGYDEINLNVGCPSDRVRSGAFGACLMAHPGLVADCVSAMQASVSIPVTVKNRIGIDDGFTCNDSFEFLADFTQQVSAAGCELFIVHARKAVLGGLSPKQNLNIPPLRYSVVAQLKQAFPELRILINGGIRDVSTATEQLQHVDGVMIGRQAYKEPYLLAELQQACFDSVPELPKRESVVHAMAEYAATQLTGHTRMHHITRHMAGLYSGAAGARRWRRELAAARTPDDLHHLAKVTLAGD
jgi:tRNA-dihydrouridine synthase A